MDSPPPTLSLLPTPQSMKPKANGGGKPNFHFSGNPKKSDDSLITSVTLIFVSFYF